MKPIVVKKEPLGEYSVAPYNFVSLPKFTVNRYNSLEQLPGHNNFRDRKGNQLLSGYVDYTLEARTPVIISGGKDGQGNNKFFKNPNGKYAIPGSSIRGMVRTNAQILSCSNVVGEGNENGDYLNSEIGDSRFLYRDIAGNNALSDQYLDTLGISGSDNIARNLRVGYMRQEGKRYYIYPTKETKTDNPYYKINELRLRKIASGVKGIKYMYNRDLIKKEDEIRRLNKSKRFGKRNSLLKSHEETGFRSYILEVSYNTDRKNRVTKIGNPGECSSSGYLLTSNHICGKISHYLVPGEDKDKAKDKICIDDKFIESYKDDMLMTKKAENRKGKIIVKQGYLYYSLPRKGEVKPVFYIQLGDDLHFGFTPYLRVTYSKSVLDGIPEHYNDTKGISYVEGIFGFSNKTMDNEGDEKQISYRSRVSFEDAEVVGQAKVDRDSTIEILLAEPKHTSFNLYLEQDLSASKKELNLYEDRFLIRGFKQYWLKDYVEDPKVSKGNMTSKIYPLREGTRFQGRIHFYNLNKDELGLLLWSLKLEEGTYQNIGLAKPYGFGRIKIKDMDLYVENLEKKYGSFSFDYQEKKNLDSYIGYYKNVFSERYLQGREINNLKPIKELMKIKTKVVKKKDANYYRYMKIVPRPNEFKDKNVLPGILDYESVINRKGKGSRNRMGNRGKKKGNKGRNRGRKRSRKQESFGVRIDLSKWEEEK